jgi:hypothetical protein
MGYIAALSLIQCEAFGQATEAWFRRALAVSSGLLPPKMLIVGNVVFQQRRLFVER